MTTYATCGHLLTEDEDLGVMLSVTGYGRECDLAVFYGSYCDKCAKELREGGYVLETEEEEHAWMAGKLDRPSWY